jgi:hypothetical protein
MSVGVRWVTKVPKYKGGTFKCIRKQFVDGSSGGLQRSLAPGKADHDPGKQELQSQSPQHRLQPDGATVSGADVSDR